MKFLGESRVAVWDNVTPKELAQYISQFGHQNIVDNINIFVQVSKLNPRALADNQKFFDHQLKEVDYIIASADTDKPAPSHAILPSRRA